MLTRHIFPQDLPAIVFPHTSVQLDVTAGSLPYWQELLGFTSSGTGLPGGPACNVVMCLSLWHSEHLTWVTQSFVRWLVVVRQWKQIWCWLSRFFLSVRGMALKAWHLLSWCDSLWMTHNLAGSRVVELLSAASVMSVLSAMRPCSKDGSSVGLIGCLTGSFSEWHFLCWSSMDKNRSFRSCAISWVKEANSRKRGSQHHAVIWNGMHAFAIFLGVLLVAWQVSGRRVHLGFWGHHLLLHTATLTVSPPILVDLYCPLVPMQGTLRA